MTYIALSGPKTIAAANGARVRATPFGAKADADTYWLRLVDAKVASDWEAMKPDEDITQAAYVRQNAVRIDQYDRLPSKTEEARPHPFKIGDVVMLKSGGHPMVVTGLRCSEGTCADPYAGQLEQVSVIWSQMSQMDGFDLRADELDPRLLDLAATPRPERCPF